MWDVKTGKLHTDLPGHQDEVFAVDWSPDGKKVSSGGKDKVSALTNPPFPPDKVVDSWGLGSAIMEILNRQGMVNFFTTCL